ncbi:hypothetical protein BRC70_06455 [Halobacteriales archaeon QH_6_68_27]|nr:MAG: hypothetical protein BRC70_06455 [Halobacteriales archaeon QH_6_68_27]
MTREGQVTIPKRFREEFGLEEGDELLREKTEDGITAFGEPRLSSRATRNLRVTRRCGSSRGRREGPLTSAPRSYIGHSSPS